MWWPGLPTILWGPRAAGAGVVGAPEGTLEDP